MLKTPLPFGWKKTALDHVAEVQTGIAKGKAINGVVVTLPYLRVANVQDGHVDLSVIKEITLKPSEVQRYSLRAGDVLFTEGGDFDKLGRGTVWNGEIQPCLHQNHVFAVRPKTDRLLPEFLAFQAASEYGRRYFQLSSKQSTNLASINSTQLKQFPVLLPSLPEQRKIAEILRTWDEAIEKLEALRAAKKKVRDAALQKILNNPNWPEASVGELGTVSSAGVDKKSVAGERPVRLLNFVDVLRRDFFYDAEFTHQVTAPARKVSTCDVRMGDVFFTPSSETRNDIAHSAVAMETMPDVVYSYHVVRLRLTATLDLRFLAYVFKSSYFLRQAYALAAGSGQRYVLSQDQFRQMTVRLPDYETQADVSAYFATADHEICLLEAEIKALTRQKRGLMQKLLTGEWRVKVESGS